MLTAVPASPVGEHDIAILKELGLKYKPAAMVSTEHIAMKKSGTIQTRFERLDAAHVEALESVSSEELPAIVLFIDNQGDLVILSGLHRGTSRKKLDVKAVIVPELEGLSIEDPRILELAAQFNTKHGKRENNTDFLVAHAVWLVQERGYSVARAAEQQGLASRVVNHAVKTTRVKAAAAKLGADMNLPMQALEHIVKIKDRDLVQAVCAIPVKGVAAEGVDFPQYIVPKVLKHKDKAARLLEIQKLTVEYRSKHEDYRMGVKPVAGEGSGLGGVTRGNGQAFPGSPADVARKAADKARTQINKIITPARALSMLDINALLATPGASSKQKQDALRSLREARDHITQALDAALVA